mmetsp:Transcript_16249/g.30371  ORF Transcript_16249/g.30371 Transcript_16249/m.30371 type:complete len:265 (-) Transcript_16249:81-875(-)
MAGRTGAIHAANRRRRSNVGHSTASARVSRTSTPQPPPVNGAAAEELEPAFVPLPPLAVAPYLEAYGYQAADANAWQVPPCADGSAERGTQLELGVVGHTEVDGHTWYTIVCSLAFGKDRGSLDWRVHRRLVQLREYLHAHVKTEMGEDTYQKHFADAHFARSGGLPGTTARLHTWCGALTACINTGRASPAVVALVLHFFEAPERDLDKCETMDDGDIEVCLEADDEEPRQIASWSPSLRETASAAPAPRTRSRSIEDLQTNI